MCEIFNCSKSGYYKWLRRKSNKTKKDRNDEIFKDIILQIHNKRKIYGYRRVTTEIVRTTGEKVNHKRIYRLMRELGIRSIIRKRKYSNKVWHSHADNIITSNILQRKFKASLPNQKFVTDITYLILGDNRLYLSVVLDLFNNEVVGFKISKNNDTALVVDTIKQILLRNKDVSGAILHSDQGHQYTSKIYNRQLKEYGMIQSMSRRGNCLDNAPIESFFSHLKSEAIYTRKIHRLEELPDIVHNYINFYNNERHQERLNKMTPVEYRCQYKTA